MTEEEYWFWLCNIKNLWQMQIKKLLEHFGSPKEIFDAAPELIEAFDIYKKMPVSDIVESRKNTPALKKLEKLKKNNIDFIYYSHPLYPKRLKILEDCPYSLYVKGELPKEDKYSVGIVGARQCSGYGKEMTLKYSKILAAGDIQIISGMALGIDSYASEGALMAGGKTFVVLGSGIDEIYPRENIELYYRIVMQGGVISEYPMGTKGVGWHFPHRNRIISALSDKLLIMEARKQSGTLTTAQHALNQGIDIYALPGKITDSLSEGCNRLIADGCGILLDAESLMADIHSRPPGIMSLEKYYDNIPDAFENEIMSDAETGRYNMQNQESHKEETNDIYIKDREEKNNYTDDSKINMAVYRNISYEPQNIQKIIEKSNIKPDEVLTAVTQLELMDLIVEVSKDYYARA